MKNSNRGEKKKDHCPKLYKLKSTSKSLLGSELSLLHWARSGESAPVVRESQRPTHLLMTRPSGAHPQGSEKTLPQQVMNVSNFLHGVGMK